MRGLELRAGVGFLLVEREVGLQGLAFVNGVLVSLADLLQPGGDGGLGELVLVVPGVVQQPAFAAVFLGHFLHLLGHAGEQRLQRLDGDLFLGVVAGDDERGRDQLGGVFLFAEDEVGPGLGLLHLVLDDEPGLGGLAPAIGCDEVAVVLQGLGPIVHEVLIDIVGV